MDCCSPPSTRALSVAPPLFYATSPACTALGHSRWWFAGGRRWADLPYCRKADEFSNKAMAFEFFLHTLCDR